MMRGPILGTPRNKSQGDVERHGSDSFPEARTNFSCNDLIPMKEWRNVSLLL